MKRANALLLLGLGCLAAGAQLQVVREFLTQFTGNELSLGGIFACWFLGIVLGAGLGGRISRTADGARTVLLYVCSALVLAVFGLLAGARLWRYMVHMDVGQLPALGDLLLSGLCLVTPLGLLVGLAFPLACQALVSEANPAQAQKDGTAQGALVGRVYIWESGGAIVGGLTMSVILAGRLMPLASLTILSLPLLAGLVWVGYRRNRPAALLALTLALVLLGSWAGGYLGDLDRASARLRFDSLKTGGLYQSGLDSPNQRLDLAQRAGQYNLFSDGKFRAAFPDPYSTKPRAHLVLCQHPSPKQVLYIGSTASGFLPTALTHPLHKLDQVASDPAESQLLIPVLPALDRKALDDPRLTKHTGDGRRFLRSSDGHWDLIFADTPDPHSASSNRFYTQEFFALAQEHLAPQGLLAIRISSAVGVLGQDEVSLLAGLRRTMKSVFKQVLLIPGQETFLFGGQGEHSLARDAHELAKRYGARAPSDPDFDPLLFHNLVQPEALDDVLAQLALHPGPELNSDGRPVTYLHSVLSWSRMTNDLAAGPLSTMARLPLWVWFVLLLGPLLLGAAFILPSRVGKDQAIWRTSIMAISVSGALGMALELVVSFAYQAQVGSLYRELGLLVAAFMAGLVLGGFLMDRYLSKRQPKPIQLGITLLLMAAFVFGLPVLLELSWLHSSPVYLTQICLGLLVLIAGAGTGLIFPLAGQLAVGTGKPLGRAAGGLDAWDHLGALMGSLLTGLLLVPILGRTATCLLLGSVCATGGLFSLLASRKQG